MRFNFTRFERNARYVMLFGSASLLALVVAGKFLLAHLIPQLAKDMPKPRIEIASGYPVAIGSGRVARVFGDDEGACSEGGGASGLPCRVLKVEPGTSRAVTLVVDGQVWREVWTFIEDTDGIKIRRTNGEYVGVPAKS